MNALTLYQIADQYIADAERLKELDLDEQTMLDTLEGMAGDLETKATNIAALARNIDAAAAAIKEAESAMAKRRKALENRAERLREYLMANMNRTGITKIESPWFVIAVRNNPESLIVTDEASIPSEYFEQLPPPPPSLDKKRLKEAIKSGLVVDGAHLERGQRLEIK